METIVDFYRSLKPGDVITTVGCQPAGKEELLTTNHMQHEKWGRYGRVTAIGTKKDLKDGDIGIRLEGIDPSLKECFWHTAREGDKRIAKMRRATDMEHKTFMEEYLKVRLQFINHQQHEMEETAKRINKERTRLRKIAKAEHIDTKKLIG